MPVWKNQPSRLWQDRVVTFQKNKAMKILKLPLAWCGMQEASETRQETFSPYTLSDKDALPCTDTQ